ncbi:BT_3928 family protein [Dysgonomonas macrotermitis]|uniref:DoxX protein n=1 Tax=Dysgonomonas macrotermitis TaxID=1346286 RepID=A0A1M5CBE5_9BACT|nr:BT_3928 family protein [Dysgonomonas macrotermitis]SHF51996.1 DoxX protein [Dysgonomonas macrotermitis]
MGQTKSMIEKAIVEVARILLAATFIFSGFVKSIDPLGTAYKVQDYMTSFGFSELHQFALPISIALCAGELCLGIFMLFGLYRKWTSRLLFIVLLFMTPLTLYLAITNPVKDCGCFGDALIITNWQTFFKNIILLACSITTLFWYEKIMNIFTGKFYWLVAIYIIAGGIVFCIFNTINEPLIDFRPYKIGANIPKLMTVEENKAPVYENTFIYKKDGVEKEFTEDNYPWQDSTWIFVDRYNKLIKEGEEPVIHDFSINRLYLNKDKTEIEAEEDITNEVLSDSNYIFLMIAYSLTDMRINNLDNFEDVNNYAKDHQYKFYCLTSSPRDTIIQFENDNITNFDFCLTDERTLKTITRSNPGLLLIKDGIIINKWGDKKVPNEKELNRPIEELPIAHPENNQAPTTRDIANLILLFFIPLAVVKILDAVLYHRKSITPKGEQKNKSE